jgi:poly-gamma-glutamate synthesis protein (capsule biosynthesis protein)
MINILIGGDIYPAGLIQKAFLDGNAIEIFNDLLEEIVEADLSVVNLECPLVSRETAISKAGPILGASTQCIKGFVASNVSVLNLANNHSNDHGARGLQETMSTAEKAGVNIVGAGMNLKEAQVPLVKQINGQRVVIYAMAEREFSIADHNTPGANPLDLINFIKAIQLYKENGIFITLIHGGAEFYPYPSPELLRRCRFMVDMGADAVICCHAHCPLPWEYYANRPIVYGLGNLIFEAPQEQLSTWNEGYLAKLTIRDAQVFLEPIPYFQSQERPGAQKMDPISRRIFLDEMHIKGTQLKDNNFVEAQWLEYCRKQTNHYLAGLFGYNKIMRKMQNILLETLHSKKEILRALHLVQCEVHQEILNTIFKDKRKGGAPE